MKLIEVDGIEYEVMPMAQAVVKTIVDPIRNGLLPARFLKRLARRSESPLIKESLIRPGGWRSMQIVYENQPPVDWMDRMAVRYNPISMAARNRRKLVTRQLASLLKEFSRSGPLQLLGIGAGPGLHLQDAVVQAGLSPSSVGIWLVDRDADAFDYGRECAAERGLAEAVHFVQGDAREIRRTLPNVRPQVIKIVGLLEYLDDTQALQLLSALREIIHPRGRLLTHGLIDVYNAGPFLARTFGLRHVQRTELDVDALLRQSGFSTAEVFHTPMGIYPLVLGRAA